MDIIISCHHIMSSYDGVDKRGQRAVNVRGSEVVTPWTLKHEYTRAMSKHEYTYAMQA